MRQVEGSLAQVDAQIPALEAGLDAAMNALDVLLAAQPGTYRGELTPATLIPMAPSLADAGSPADVIRRRPDLIVAERQLAAANARIGVAISEYYPKFSLSALLGSATAVSSGNLMTSARASIRACSDFAGACSTSAVSMHRSPQLAADRRDTGGYRLAVLRATEEVENSFSALVNREAQVDILTQGESSLTRARESSLAAYKGGVVSLIEVLDADTNLLQVQDAKAQAQTEAARAAIASFRALGGGWNAT